jgi:hypothetical protein
MAIWVIKDGQREGPYDEEDVRELIYEGTYGDADPAIRDGQYDWSTLGQILGHPMPPFESALSSSADPLVLDLPPEEPIPVAVASEPPPIPERDPVVIAATPAQSTPVAIVDFQVPFGSVFVMVLKVALALVLVSFILSVFAAIFWAGMLAFLTLVLHH